LSPGKDTNGDGLINKSLDCAICAWIKKYSISLGLTGDPVMVIYKIYVRKNASFAVAFVQDEIPEKYKR